MATEYRPWQGVNNGSNFMTVKDRIREKIAVDAETGCWNWLGMMIRDGRYPAVWVEGKSVRVQFAMAREMRPERDEGYGQARGWYIRVDCGNARCVRIAEGHTRFTQERYYPKNGGNFLRGAARSNSKLTEAQVLEIRSGSESVMEMARRYGVTHVTIRSVLARKTWRHI